MTEKLTMAKARRVPMEARLLASSTVTKAAKKATIPPVAREVIQGVWKRGWTRPKIGGRRPSRDMFQKMRDWP